MYAGLGDSLTGRADPERVALGVASGLASSRADSVPLGCTEPVVIENLRGEKLRAARDIPHPMDAADDLQARPLQDQPATP